MACNCGNKAKRYRTPYPERYPAPGSTPIASSGEAPTAPQPAPRYELIASGQPQQFSTRLEADAARVRQGGGGIIREL